MFVVKQQLTNTRPPDSIYPELTVSPTEGNMKLSPEACELLGVAKGDYVGVVKGEVEGKVAFYIHKGQASDDGNVGSKLAPSNKGGSELAFSSMNAWKQLGGNDKEGVVYRLKGLSDERIQKLVEQDPAIRPDANGNKAWESEVGAAQEADGVTYFPLEEVRREDKVIRGKSEKGEGEEVEAGGEEAIVEEAPKRKGKKNRG